MIYSSLHSHTIYSSLDGHTKVEDYVSTVKALGHTHAAITDHGTMAGVPLFIDQCEKAGIIPIVGCEAYVEPNGADIKDDEHKGTYHLTLLAYNREGYDNLSALATSASTTGFYRKPRIDWNGLEAHNKGLIVLSGCVSGELASRILDSKPYDDVLEFYSQTFKDRYFLEFQNHGNFVEQQLVNRTLRTIQARTGLPIVATNDSHFCAFTDRAAQKLVVAIRYNQRVEEVESGSDYTFIRDNDQMLQAFTEEMLHGTMQVAEMVESYKLGDKTPKLPVSPLEVRTEPPITTLLRLATAGLHTRLPAGIPQDYWDRLSTEIEVIRTLSGQLGADFGRYLLMIADIARFSKRQGIRFGPRGSAAGSIICWALGISEPDPIKEGLYFERFLNPYRVEMPDVDMDFADDRRDEIFAYIKKTYGEENVAKIGTYAMIGAKQAINDCARSLEKQFSHIEGGHRWAASELIKLIPEDPRPGGIPLHEIMDDVHGRGKPINELLHADTETAPLMRLIIANALSIEGRMRGDGMHAAGVVVSDRSIRSITPLGLTNAARKGTDVTIPVQTQYEMTYLENLGLLKVDILGLKTLSVMEQTLKRLEGRLDPWTFPWDDDETWALIRSGRTLSLFQIGSEGLGNACLELQPDNIIDLALTIAVYRPGPMGNFKTIVARKHGKEEIRSLHESIDHIVAPTYGFPVFQEQVMEIARSFAGYSLGEADLLRKAMGKKIREKMAAEKIKFTQGALALGRTPEDIDRIWNFLVPFADYGFNKAHAICYAYVAYQTAYLKAHYTQNFYSAALTVENTTGGQDSPQQRIGALAREADQLGIEVQPPHISRPSVGFEPEGERKIRYGLSCIKGIGVSDAQAIVDGFPYIGITDLVYRSGVKRSSLEVLALVGGCDGWFNRRILCEKTTIVGPRGGVKELSLIGQLVEQRSKLKRTSVFEDESYEDELTPRRLKEFDVGHRLRSEQGLLGIFSTPFPRINEPVTDIKEVREDSLFAGGPNKLENRSATLRGIMTSVTYHVTRKKNEEMCYCVLIDETDPGIDVIIFPHILVALREEGRANQFLREGELVFINGKIRTDAAGTRRIFVDRMWQDEQELDTAETDQVLGDGIRCETLEELTRFWEIALKESGTTPLVVVYKSQQETAHVSQRAADQIRTLFNKSL